MYGGFVKSRKRVNKEWLYILFSIVYARKHWTLLWKGWKQMEGGGFLHYVQLNYGVLLPRAAVDNGGYMGAKSLWTEQWGENPLQTISREMLHLVSKP